MQALEKIGITALKTDNQNFSGDIFKDKEDFIVQEIELDKDILSIDKIDSAKELGVAKGFLWFTLVKKGLSTQEALRIIAKENRLNIKRLGYLGNKDKNAITAQRISVFKGDYRDIKKDYGGFFLKDFVYSEHSCKIGALYGNRFVIKIRDFVGKEKLNTFLEQIKTGIPNFYGPQHFGASALNVEISKDVIARDFRKAIFNFALNERDESEIAIKARSSLKETFSAFLLEEGDLNQLEATETLNSLPGFFYLEKQVLNHLLLNKHDYIGAFRLIPKYFRLLIIQSFQAYFFNLVLSNFIKSGNNLPASLPTIGYDLELNNLDDNTRASIKATMENLDINDTSNLKINEMPEASLKTFQRESLIYPENVNWSYDSNNLILEFDLKKGAYATIFLLEMLRRFN